MNRAARRGNRGREGLAARVLESWAAARQEVRQNVALTDRNMATARALSELPSKPARSVKEANERPRAAGGRFAASKGALGAQVVLPPALTRQERRNQKRLAAKLSGAWRDVTGGKGVTLLDGKEVHGDT